MYKPMYNASILLIEIAVLGLVDIFYDYCI